MSIIGRKLGKCQKVAIMSKFWSIIDCSLLTIHPSIHTPIYTLIIHASSYNVVSVAEP